MESLSKSSDPGLHEEQESSATVEPYHFEPSEDVSAATVECDESQLHRLDSTD